MENVHNEVTWQDEFLFQLLSICIKTIFDRILTMFLESKQIDIKNVKYRTQKII